MKTDEQKRYLISLGSIVDASAMTISSDILLGFKMGWNEQQKEVSNQAIEIEAINSLNSKLEGALVNIRTSLGLAINSMEHYHSTETDLNHVKCANAIVGETLKECLTLGVK